MNNQLMTLDTQNMGMMPAPSPTPVLDRAHLQFYSGMIRAAGLIPNEPNVPPAMAEARVMAKIVYGSSYGFNAVQSQRAFHIINGAIVLSAEGLHTLLLQTGRYQTREVYLDDTGCKVEVFTLEAGEWVKVGTVEFTVKDAERAELLKNPSWKKYPKDMCYARVITRVVRRFAREVLAGQPVVHDLAKREAEAAPEAQTETAPTTDATKNVRSFPAATETADERKADTAPDVDPFEAVESLISKLKKAGDSIKWTAANRNEFVVEYFGDDALTFGDLNDAQLAELERELTARYAALTTEETND